MAESNDATSNTMKPSVRFLSDELIRKIISEAKEILWKLGIKIYDDDVLSLLDQYGAQIDSENKTAYINPSLIDNALKTVPKAFKLYNVMGEETHDFSGDHVYFTPASSSLNILDFSNQKHRPPNTSDYIDYVKLASQLNYLASQSTAFVPSDVEEKVSDSYRLYLNLLLGEKPVVTGTFNENGLNVMKDLQVAIRGSEKALKEKPLSIFSCCPTTPLKWSERICRDIVQCGRCGIPIEIISMPLTGFTGPVTLIGSLTGHTAENLSGIVISQLSNPGAPLLYGGAISSFDMRQGTTPLGAVESQMMVCAYNEIGKFLGLPTQAYIALSDSKFLDAQAGSETSMGATLAMLSGINSISGPGMLDFVNCFSLEKLVMDNEICGMTYRMAKGIHPKDDFPILPIYEELLNSQHLLSSPHTLRYFKDEHYFPGKTIDRTTHSKFEEQGKLSLRERAHAEVERLIKSYKPSRLSRDVKRELTKIMDSEAKRLSVGYLPEIPEIHTS